MDRREIEEAIAVLEAGAMDDVADYVMRGRRLKHLADVELGEHFLGRARAWAASPRNGMIAGEIADVTSEFTLRGGVPPLDAAREHLAAAVTSISGEGFMALSPKEHHLLLSSLGKDPEPTF